MQKDYRFENPLGYAQFTAAAATSLPSIPTGAVLALITTETQAIRWRDDGSDPTAAVGYPLPLLAELQYTGNLSKLRLIQQAATATINVAYYGQGTLK